MPFVLLLITLSWAVLWASVMVTTPVWVVMVPENAASRSVAVPESAPLVTSRVIAPVVELLIAISWARVGALVMLTSKWVGSVSRSVMACRTAAAVPLMSVREVPSMFPLPLADSMEEISVASATPLSLESKLTGSVSRAPPLAARTPTASEALPLMSVRAVPSM